MKSPQHGCLSKDDTNRHARVDGKVHDSSALGKQQEETKEHTKGTWKSLPQGRAHKLVIQHQMISPEDVYIQTAWVVLVYLRIHIYAHTCICVQQHF